MAVNAFEISQELSVQDISQMILDLIRFLRS